LMIRLGSVHDVALSEPLQTRPQPKRIKGLLRR
jgi:hypothetical protein